jgi:hypothetical protein
LFRRHLPLALVESADLPGCSDPAADQLGQLDPTQLAAA